MILKSHDLLALLPFFIVVAFALIVVLFDVVHKTKKGRTYLANIASLGMLLGLGAILFIGEKVPAGSAFSGMIYHDHFSLFLNSLFLISGIATVQLSPRYLREHGVERGEFYALVMLATTGMMLMAAGGDLIIVFLGLEVMSVAVYVLVGFFRADARSAESSLKYFFLGAFASAIFLYGMALLYGTTGATSLEGISEALTSSTSLGDQTLVRTGAQGEPAQLEPLFYIGALLLLVGMAFKIALAPFHMWTPDAYSGAPASTAGFMATAVKAAGFAALIRVLFIAFDVEASRLVAQGWVPLFFYLSIITVVIGNLMAIVQTKIKRMLAYSSIAHAGYATIGLVAAGYIGEGEQGQAAFGFVNVDAVLFYLLIYTVATIGAFGVLAYLGSKDKDIETYEDFSGVGYRHPKVGLAMAIFMLSSAGIPPTAGFVAKFAVFQNAIAVGSAADDSSFFWLVVIALLASVAGAFYYLRVIGHMYMKPERKIVPKRESSGAFGCIDAQRDRDLGYRCLSQACIGV